jgi:hypothetical protein
VPFRRTCFELVRRVSECDMPPGEMRDRIEYSIRRAFPDIWEPIPDELSWSVGSVHGFSRTCAAPRWLSSLVVSELNTSALKSQRLNVSTGFNISRVSPVNRDSLS